MDAGCRRRPVKIKRGFPRRAALEFLLFAHDGRLSWAEYRCRRYQSHVGDPATSGRLPTFFLNLSLALRFHTRKRQRKNAGPRSRTRIPCGFHFRLPNALVCAPVTGPVKRILILRLVPAWVTEGHSPDGL